MNEYYVGNYVVFEEFGKVKITSKENYEAVYCNAHGIIVFDGTLNEAVEYIKQNLGGN